MSIQTTANMLFSPLLALRDERSLDECWITQWLILTYTLGPMFDPLRDNFLDSLLRFVSNVVGMTATHLTQFSPEFLKV